MMRRFLLFLSVFLLALLHPVFIQDTHAGVVGTNTIDNVTVTIPACSGFDGRVSIDFTIDHMNDHMLHVITSAFGAGANVGSAGAGSYTSVRQFIPITPPGVLPNGTIITLTVELRNLASTVIYDSEVIEFVCDTGEIMVDTDGDGVYDNTDNCPTVPNIDQADTDNNGVGDACDVVVVPPAPVVNVVPQDYQFRIFWRTSSANGAVVAYLTTNGLEMYCFSGGVANLAMTITPTSPASTVDEGMCRMAFYVLDGGRYQLNVWLPDGKLHEIFANNRRFDAISIRTTDPAR